MKSLNKTKMLVIMAFCSAILVIAQVGLAVIPNVELVSLLCILYTLYFRQKALVIIYVFVAVEGIIFGFGLWWISYLYIWTILWIITMFVSKWLNSVIGWAAINGFFGLFFGFLTSFPYLFMGGIPMAFSYWVNGLAFDIAHCVGNAVTTILLFHPLCYVFNRFFGKRKKLIEK